MTRHAWPDSPVFYRSLTRDFPLIVRGVGVLSSIIGTYVVKGDATGKSGNAMAAIFRGFLSSAAISAVMFFIAGFVYLNKPEMDAWGGWWRMPMAATP